MPAQTDMRTRRGPARGRKNPPGRPKLKSHLPPPVPGQAFSILGALRCTDSLLSVADAARLLGRTKQTVYEALNKGKIPEAFMPGLPGRFIDAAAWVDLIEHDNPHLKPSSRKYLEACA